MKRAKAWVISLSALAVVAGALAISTKGRIVWPDVHLLFNGWRVSPTGDHTAIGDMALKLILSPDGHQAVVTSVGFDGVHLTSVDLATRKVIQDDHVNSVWNGLAFSRDGKTLYVGTGNGGKVEARSYDAGRTTARDVYKSKRAAFIAGLAVGPDELVYACDELDGSIVVIDPNGMTERERIPVSPNPYAAVFGNDPRYLYVSCWGAGSVSIIDTQNDKVVRKLPVGPHPNDMALAPDGRLFVCCAGDNSVYVIHTKTLANAPGKSTRETRLPEGSDEILNTCIVPTSLEGSTPVGASVSPDGKALYVVNAQNNDVMVADISNPDASHILGFIPTGWYPTTVLATDKALLVTQGKGLSSTPNFPNLTNPSSRDKNDYTYIGRTFRGYLSFVPIPTAESLKIDTELVRANTPFTIAALKRRTPIPAVPEAVTTRPIDQRPIQHVVYVIMENRTFDQVFGDLKGVNGDPNLTMYGEDVTPNRHKLAREWVALDNLYCNGEVSEDGHQWCDAAISSDGNQRDWTSGYSGHGGVEGSDDVQLVTGDYLWEATEKAGLSTLAYGEGTGSEWGRHTIPSRERGTWPGGRDKDRIDGFIADLHNAEKAGSWANFMIMSLGEDHTRGTTPGRYTPEACVASNDLAIGKMIEAVSHSKFWKSTVLFFIEDDAQNGPDHVDSHRTFGLVVGPYVKRHTIVHTMYSTACMVRTIEEILGPAPLSQYDAAAEPMLDCFTAHADLKPYEKVAAKIDVDAKNTARSPGAKISETMDFSEYDRADPDKLNRILWAEAKGPNVPYPAAHRTFWASR